MSQDLFEQAQAAHQAGDAATAERLYRAVLDSAPDNFQAHRLLAILLFQIGAPEKSEFHFARAAELAPGESYIHQNHSMLLNALGRHAEAAQAASRALALMPDYALAYFNRAAAWCELRRLDESIADYRRATALGLSDPAVFFGLAYTLALDGRRDDALAEYDRAIALNPDFIQAIANRGIVLKDMGRLPEALAAFQRAVQLNPGIAESHNQLGTVLHEMRRAEEAMAAFQTALVLKPDYAKAMLNIGNVLASLDRHEEALAAYERAAAIAPDLPYLEDSRLRTAMHLCDWNDFEARSISLLTHVEQGRPVQPFSLLCLASTAAQQRQCAETFAREKCPPRRPILRQPRKPGRLRIAYVTTIFRHHAVSLLITGMLEKHDRENFEIFGIAHGHNDQSPARYRMIAACEHFFDAAGWDDKRIAEKIRDLDIDIAIDLDGYTEDARPAILSYRPAPVQVNFLGYPGTMGAPHIDYIIGDAIVTPPGMSAHFSEQVVTLPGAYQPNSIRPDAPAPTRTEAGLPEGAFVFGCFNNHYKITPATFDVWMRILARVPGSVLWLLVPGLAARENLRGQARAHGIDPARLVFAPRADWQDHLARQGLMDVFLDTFFYGAHTTASDALWSGVPIVTELGDTFPARVAASLLAAAGLPELVTANVQEYENLAVELAQDGARLSALKEKLRAARDTAPLFDAARFARHLEAALRHMAQRQQGGQPPQAFAIPG